MTADHVSLPTGYGSTTGTMTSGAANYIYTADSYTPSRAGLCIVSATVEFPSISTTTGLGPFFRIAYRAGGSDLEDGYYGHYPAQTSRSMSRTSRISVSAGVAYQFGCYLGFPEASWGGDTAYCHVTWFCF